MGSKSEWTCCCYRCTDRPTDRPTAGRAQALEACLGVVALLVDAGADPEITATVATDRDDERVSHSLTATQTAALALPAYATAKGTGTDGGSDSRSSSSSRGHDRDRAMREAIMATLLAAPANQQPLVSYTSKQRMAFRSVPFWFWLWSGLIFCFISHIVGKCIAHHIILALIVVVVVG